MVPNHSAPNFPVRRTLSFQAPIDQRPVVGQYERAVNRLQSRLVRAYDAWARVTRGEMQRAIQKGSPSAILNSLVDARVDMLALELGTLMAGGVAAAGALGVGRAGVRHPIIKSAINKRIAREQGYIQTSLAPDIKNKIRQDVIQAGMADRAAVKERFDTFRPRVASYAGGAWVMIFEAQRAEGKERERETGEAQRVRWVLDDRAVHCEASAGRRGCPELEGEYDSWQDLVTVPAGEVTCAGNCRCHLEVFEDGEWQRGL